MLLNYRTYKGHLVGHITIEPIAQDDESDSSAPVFDGKMRIPFKNENLICEHTDNSGASQVRVVICHLPSSPAKLIHILLDRCNGPRLDLSHRR